MDVGSLYQSKLTTPDQAMAAVRSGSKLSMGMAMAEPPALLKALADRAGQERAGRLSAQQAGVRPSGHPPGAHPPVAAPRLARRELAADPACPHTAPAEFLGDAGGRPGVGDPGEHLAGRPPDVHPVRVRVHGGARHTARPGYRLLAEPGIAR